MAPLWDGCVSDDDVAAGAPEVSDEWPTLVEVGVVACNGEPVALEITVAPETLTMLVGTPLDVTRIVWFNTSVMVSGAGSVVTTVGPL